MNDEFKEKQIKKFKEEKSKAIKIILIVLVLVDLYMIITILPKCTSSNELLADIFGIIVSDIFYIIIAYLCSNYIYKNKVKSLINRKEILKNRFEYKKAIDNNYKLYFYDNNNIYKKMLDQKKKILKILTILSIIVFILGIIFFNPFLLLFIFIPLYDYYYQRDYIVKSNKILIPSILIETDNKLIVVKAKEIPQKYDANLVSTSLAASVDNNIANAYAIGNSKSLLDQMFSLSEFDEDLLNRLKDSNEVLNIIKNNDSKYIIESYNDVTLIKDTKYYKKYDCNVILSNGERQEQEIKIYKIYKDFK